jgi:hypothetical protein
VLAAEHRGNGAAPEDSGEESIASLYIEVERPEWSLFDQREVE